MAGISKYLTKTNSKTIAGYISNNDMPAIIDEKDDSFTQIGLNVVVEPNSNKLTDGNNSIKFDRVDDNFDGLTDGDSYKKTTVNEKTGAGRAYSALNSSNRLTTGIQTGSYTVNVSELRDTHLRTQAGLDADGYAKLGISPDGVNFVTASQAITDHDKVYAAINEGNKIITGIQYGDEKAGVDELLISENKVKSLITKNNELVNVNLIQNPFFTDGVSGWESDIGLSGIESNITVVDSNELLVTTYTPSDVRFVTGNYYDIICAAFPFASYPDYAAYFDGSGGGYIHVHFTGTTASLEGKEYIVASMTPATNTIRIKVFGEFDTISTAEQFKVCIRPLISPKAVELSGDYTQYTIKSNRIPIRYYADAIPILLLFFEARVKTGNPSISFPIRFYDSEGVLLGELVYRIAITALSYDCYQKMLCTYVMEELALNLVDGELIYGELCFIKDSSIGYPAYITDISLSFANADGSQNVAYSKDSPLMSGELIKSINKNLENINGIESLRKGLTAKNTLLTVPAIFSFTASGTSKTITREEILSACGDTVEIPAGFSLVMASIQVEEEQSGYFSIHPVSNIRIYYERSGSFDIIDYVTIGVTSSNSYNVLFNCAIIDIT